MDIRIGRERNYTVDKVVFRLDLKNGGWILELDGNRTVLQIRLHLD
jgi:hypothetical protein